MKSKEEQEKEKIEAYMFAKDQNDPLFEELKDITNRRKEISKILIKKYRDYKKKNGTI